MLLKETISYLRRRRKLVLLRSVAPVLTPLPSTGRLPRYRVFRPDNAQDLLVGVTLANKYYVLSVLGYGGMSVVYKGKQLSRNRIVAVKTLRVQGLNDERTVLRFQREAELLSHLNHPRIVQVSHYGTTLRGQPYFVMDYLTGVNLSDLLKQEGALPSTRVRDIFTQVCGAVDHAHRCGVIHRDLKPGNIMLVGREEGVDLVKVVDFGIARFEEEAQRLTRMGEVWGSPIYMSPEQCTGTSLDARSDIYSIGICMYEALTGKVPFLGKNYVETMSLQIMADPKPFAQMLPNVIFPPNLERVVRKAIEKEPERRYQAMGELRHDLEEAVAAVDGGRKLRASSSAIQMPKVAPPKAASPRVSQNVMAPQSSPRVSQNVVTPPQTPRVSQTRVTPPAAPSGGNPRLSNPRITNPNMIPPNVHESRMRRIVSQVMPNFAKMCIVLAVIAVFVLASQILGDYVKSNPEWSKYWQLTPDYSLKENMEPEKEQPPTTNSANTKDNE